MPDSPELEQQKQQQQKRRHTALTLSDPGELQAVATFTRLA